MAVGRQLQRAFRRRAVLARDREVRLARGILETALRQRDLAYERARGRDLAQHDGRRPVVVVVAGVGAIAVDAQHQVAGVEHVGGLGRRQGCEGRGEQGRAHDERKRFVHWEGRSGKSDVGQGRRAFGLHRVQQRRIQLQGGEDGRRDLRGDDWRGLHAAGPGRQRDDQRDVAVVRRVAAVVGVLLLAGAVEDAGVGQDDDVGRASARGIAELLDQRRARQDSGLRAVGADAFRRAACVRLQQGDDLWGPTLVLQPDQADVVGLHQAGSDVVGALTQDTVRFQQRGQRVAVLDQRRVVAGRLPVLGCQYDQGRCSQVLLLKFRDDAAERVVDVVQCSRHLRAGREGCIHVTAAVRVDRLLRDAQGLEVGAEHRGHGGIGARRGLAVDLVQHDAHVQVVEDLGVCVDVLVVVARGRIDGADLGAGEVVHAVARRSVDPVVGPGVLVGPGRARARQSCLDDLENGIRLQVVVRMDRHAAAVLQRVRDRLRIEVAAAVEMDCAAAVEGVDADRLVEHHVPARRAGAMRVARRVQRAVVRHVVEQAGTLGRTAGEQRGEAGERVGQARRRRVRVLHASGGERGDVRARRGRHAARHVLFVQAVHAEEKDARDGAGITRRSRVNRMATRTRRACGQRRDRREGNGEQSEAAGVHASSHPYSSEGRTVEIAHDGAVTSWVTLRESVRTVARMNPRVANQQGANRQLRIREACSGQEASIAWQAEVAHATRSGRAGQCATVNARTASKRPSVNDGFWRKPPSSSQSDHPTHFAAPPTISTTCSTPPRSTFNLR